MRNLLLLLLNLALGGPVIAQAGAWTTYSRPGAVNDYLDEPDTLWLATDAGIYIIEKNTLTVSHLDKVNAGLPSLQVESIVRHPETDQLFIGTYDMALAVRQADSWISLEYPPALLNTFNPLLTYCIEFDGQGNLWVGTSNGVARLGEDGEWTVFNGQTGFSQLFSAWDMQRTPEGDVLIGSHWPWRTEGDTMLQLFPEGFADEHFIFAYGDARVHQQTNGDIWFFTDIHRAARYHDGSWEALDYFETGGPALFSMAFLSEDTEGALWTYDQQTGYQTYADGVWESTASPLDGWAPANPLALIFSGDRTFALGKEASVVVEEGAQQEIAIGNYPFLGILTQYRLAFNGDLWARDGYYHLRNLETGAVRTVAPQGDSLFIFQYTIGNDDLLWAHTDQGLWRQTAGVWERFDHTNSLLPEELGGVQIDLDAAGNLWLVNYPDALYRYDGESWERFDDLDWNQDYATDLCGGAAGEVWISIYGPEEGPRVVRFAGENMEFFGAQNAPAFGQGYVGDLFYEPAAGRIWAAGELGVIRFYDGQEWHRQELPAPPAGHQWGSTVVARDGAVLATDRYTAYWYDDEEWTFFHAGNSPLAGYPLAGAALDREGHAWFSHHTLDAVAIFETGLTTDTQSPVPDPERALHCAPNPAGAITWLTFELPAGTAAATLELLSASGQPVRAWRLPATTGPQRTPVDLSGLPAGIYWLRLWYDGKSEMQKLVKY